MLCWSIQVIGGPVRPSERPHWLSQPCIWPIWLVWVSAMSVARVRISSLWVRWPMIVAMSTACA